MPFLWSFTMNVLDLQKQVTSLSHQEDSLNSGLKMKSLQWLNHAYQEIMEEIAPFLSEIYTKMVDLTLDELGRAVLPDDFYKIEKVFLSGTELPKLTIAEAVIAEDKKGYWLERNYIHILPKNTVGHLVMLYQSTIPKLTESSLEEDILIPKNFHYALVWGALVWASVQERGFSAQSDLKLFQQKWLEAKQSLKLSLANRADQKLSVAPSENF